MNDDYEAFCMADRAFYDAPAAGSQDDAFTCSQRAAPPGWRRESDHHWVIYRPDPSNLPNQGWKIHVSGCPDNAEGLIAAVWDYCHPRGIAYKFLYSQRVLLARNAKYAGREGSGKLLTIYPRDEVELELACKELDEVLSGQPGPYILSDLRWSKGPLYVRYGGFTPRHCIDERGSIVLAIEDASGQLVPDTRGPTFVVPSWVTLPECLQPHLESRSAVTVTELPYSIDEALHFSNGGGVYAATDMRSGEKVVLKEARPYAGLSGDGSDAVTRLRREREILELLAGIDAVPQVLDAFTVGEHEFIAMRYVEGEPLGRVLAKCCPMLENAVDRSSFADYTEWALALQDDVCRAIAEIHDRGVVYGDLHTNNIMVRPDGGISLLDFEVADQVTAGTRPGLGAVGFTAPRDRHGFDIDRYALACLQLALFVPLEALISLDRAKAAELADIVAEHFPVPRRQLDPAVAVIAGPPIRQDRVSRRRAGLLKPTPWSWYRTRASLSRAIRATATPSRDDRLFPGDIPQFRTGGGLNLANGAAGVLYALEVTGAGRFPEYESWLIQHATRPEDGTPMGFYDGLHGVAHVLMRLDHRQAALDLVDMCLRERWDRSGDDLHGGVAGMGLNLAWLAEVTGEPGLDDAARRATQLVADRLGDVASVAETSGGEHPYAGLLRGSAGQALLFIRQYERAADAALLDHAAVALRQDLRRCVTREEDGQLQVNEGWRVMPYLRTGSIGIGLVLDRYLAHRNDDGFVEARQAIDLAAQGLLYSQAGLFSGRAGMVLYLSDRRRSWSRGGELPDAALAAQIRRLQWHALSYGGDLAFPGDQLLRLSMDLATGGAGVLLALGAALHDRPVQLPFLQPTHTERR